MAVIDHIVYAVPDLASAIDWFEESTGVRPALGGSHDGMGTHNALVSFGACYLELIAPDPSQPDPPSSGRPRPFGLDDVMAPGGEQTALVGFAVRPGEGETIDDLADRAADAGHDPGQVVDMSRSTPSGELLSWRLTLPTQRVLPFLIDWGETPKPHTTQPGGAELTSLAIVHPRPFDVLGVLAALDLDITVVGTHESPDGNDGTDGRLGLAATITGVHGDVEL